MVSWNTGIHLAPSKKARSLPVYHEFLGAFAVRFREGYIQTQGNKSRSCVNLCNVWKWKKNNSLGSLKGSEPMGWGWGGALTKKTLGNHHNPAVKGNNNNNNNKKKKKNNCNNKKDVGISDYEHSLNLPDLVFNFFLVNRFPTKLGRFLVIFQGPCIQKDVEVQRIFNFPSV